MWGVVSVVHEIHSEEIPGDGTGQEEVSPQESFEETFGEGHNQTGKEQW